MTAANDHTRLLRRVRQTRDLAPEPIPDDVLEEILQVARWTGSAANRQPWRFLVVRDRDRLREIGEGHPGILHVAEAGAAIAIVMPGEKPDWDAFDEGRVTERILIAAAAFDLSAAIGWLRDSYRGAVRATLGIPDELAMRTIISIGRATEAGRRPKSAPGEARRPLAELVRWERWS